APPWLPKRSLEALLSQRRRSELREKWHETIARLALRAFDVHAFVLNRPLPREELVGQHARAAQRPPAVSNLTAQRLANRQCPFGVLRMLRPFDSLGQSFNTRHIVIQGVIRRHRVAQECPYGCKHAIEHRAPVCGFAGSSVAEQGCSKLGQRFGRGGE